MITRAHSRCEGFFIRRNHWRELMMKNESFHSQIKIKTIDFYENIWGLVDEVKKKTKKKILRRKDMSHVIMLEDDDLLN